MGPLGPERMPRTSGPSAANVFRRRTRFPRPLRARRARSWASSTQRNSLRNSTHEPSLSARDNHFPAIVVPPCGRSLLQAQRRLVHVAICVESRFHTFTGTRRQNAVGRVIGRAVARGNAPANPTQNPECPSEKCDDINRSYTVRLEQNTPAPNVSLCMAS